MDYVTDKIASRKKPHLENEIIKFVSGFKLEVGHTPKWVLNFS
jgi:hypothetical protein